jgi:hypothetical protein
VRFKLLLLVTPMLLHSAELTIDHVTVAGTDLKQMQAKLAAIGIESEAGGPHANHATEMAITSFPDGSYLELIALQPSPDPQALAAHPWSKQLRDNAGTCAWAVRTKDVAAELDRLRASGVPVGALVRSGRVRMDQKRLDWETAQVGPEPNGAFFPFLIRDLTSRQDRAFPSGKPTTKDFSGVVRVVIAVRNLDDSVKRFQQAYGLHPPIKQVDRDLGAHLALLGSTPVVLAAPLHSGTWLAARLEQFGEGPCAFILGARKAGRYKAASKSRWFGVDISWFDSDSLGWHLGFE